MDWLQKLLVAPRAIPVKKKESASRELLSEKIIIKKERAKKALKSKMLFFLPRKAGNAPEAKLEIRFPTE